MTDQKQPFRWRRDSLSHALATPASKAVYVRGMFRTIADRYDLITRLLSFGRDASWKRRLVSLACASPGDRALDLACGTGDIAFELAKQDVDVVGLDLTARMLTLARAKRGDRAVRFLQGDMMALPYADASFDIVTTGYGIRNVTRIEPALLEIRRVLRPGGRLVSLDFDRPESPWIRTIYLAYLTVVGSTLGMLLHGDPDTYRYIPESIRRYPGAAAVGRLLEDLGFEAVRVLPVLGGFLAIHAAVMPSRPIERTRPSETSP